MFHGTPRRSEIKTPTHKVSEWVRWCQAINQERCQLRLPMACRQSALDYLPPMKRHSIHDPAALEAARRHAGIEPEALRRWRAAFFRRHLEFAESLKILPAESRDSFAEGLRHRFIERVGEVSSTQDRATKLAFRTDDGRVLEAVLMQTVSGRISLCVSSQLGCACNCAFCATGTLPFARNLTVDEMLDQVVQGARLAEGRLRNVVFMGMGEPLLNLGNVQRAVADLISPHLFALAERRVLVSTCGLPDAMVELARAFPGIGLGLSLHAARQEVREQLMPIAKRHHLRELRAALEAIAPVAKREVMVEVLLLDGVNDRPADAAALVEFTHDLPVYINLLTYNPIPSRPDLRPAAEGSYRLFTERLEEAGHKVTRRYSHGSDIAAACGQLAATHSAPEAAL